MAMPIDGGIVLFSLLFLACRPVAAASGASRVIVGGGGISPKSILGGENLAPWANGLLKFSPVASAPAPDGKAPLVLARKRTKRPDMLNSLRMYRDGWDVTNKHYWASVGFTGAPGFILAFIWFVLFALALVTRRCCRWRIELDKEKLIFLRQMSLVLLLVFTCAAL